MVTTDSDQVCPSGLDPVITLMRPHYIAYNKHEVMDEDDVDTRWSPLLVLLAGFYRPSNNSLCGPCGSFARIELQ